MNINENLKTCESTQIYRDKFIKMLDQAEDEEEFIRTNADTMYSLGLTMYSKDCSFESIIYNSFATSELDDGISLHPEQRRILKLISENEGIVFSAPTSFGKTFVVFEYICRNRPQNVVMVVPTLALMDEYKKKLIGKYHDKFEEYNIYLSIDPNKEYDFNKHNIFIVTHDRVIDDEVLSILECIDFLVIDEVYKLQKDETHIDDRVLILNIAYYNLVRVSKKYVLLAPFISGIENVDKLEKTPVFFSSDYSPVVNEVITCKINDERMRFKETDAILNTIPFEDNTLIYFPKVTNLESYINETSVSYSSSRMNNDKDLRNFIEWGKRDIHPEWSIIKALQKGLLVHHGQMPLGIRMMELSLFNKQNSGFKRLLCTSTLLEGVNTTAKYIIITKPARNSNNFEAFDFYNLVGRTGRLYQHCLGTAYYIKASGDPSYEKGQALKSIEFELTDKNIDMDINFGDYKTHPDFLNVLDRLDITYEEYRKTIAKKFRFNTVQKILTKYDELQNELFERLDELFKGGVSKLELIRILAKIINLQSRQPRIDTYIINRLTYKYRQTVKQVVDATMNAFKHTINVNYIINKTMKYKTSYIEYEFYSKVELIKYFMECDKTRKYRIDTLDEKLLKNIEELYFINSSSKKMLKDMGIYDGDVDAIVNVIGNDFVSVSDLKKQLTENREKFKEVSVVSKYIIDSLIESD